MSLARMGAADVSIRIWASMIVAAVACAALWINASFGRPVDRVGGVRLTYVLDTSSTRAADVVPQTLKVLKRRAARLQHGGDVAIEAHGNEIVLDLPVANARELEAAREALGEIGRLEFKLVDDDIDPIEPIARYANDELPVGLRFQIENAPVGLGRTKPVHYALMIVHGTEGMRGALARLRHWVSTTVDVPPGHEIGFEKYYEYDDQAEAELEIGWRTFCLFSTAEITSDMVRDAMARPAAEEGRRDGWFVAYELTRQGAAKFEDLTAKNVQRRFAILVDGVIQSAPVIQTRISGAHGQITLGDGSPEQQLHDARRLEAALDSGALPAPIALASEQRIERSTTAYLVGLLLPAAAALTSLVFFVLLALSVRRRPV
jgi:preprotein translocase subunit SecD